MDHIKTTTSILSLQSVFHCVTVLTAGVNLLFQRQKVQISRLYINRGNYQSNCLQTRPK